MDCSNPPIDETWSEDEDWKVIHLDKLNKTCLIRKGNGSSYPCVLADWLVDGILLHDYVDVKYNPVSRVWMVVNYRINMEVYAAIHNSYQEELPEEERDYIYNEKGEIYE